MDKKEDWNLELSEYIKQGEPNRVWIKAFKIFNKNG